MSNDFEQVKSWIEDYKKINDEYFDMNKEYTDEEEDKMIHDMAEIRARIDNFLIGIGIDSKTAHIMSGIDNLDKVYDILNKA